MSIIIEIEKVVIVRNVDTASLLILRSECSTRQGRLWKALSRLTCHAGVLKSTPSPWISFPQRVWRLVGSVNVKVNMIWSCTMMGQLSQNSLHVSTFKSTLLSLMGKTSCVEFATSCNL